MILDTNGNLILELGTYDNIDGLRRRKRGSPGVRIGFRSHTAVDSDRWLYPSDDGDRCITRVKLGYAREECVRLGK